MCGIAALVAPLPAPERAEIARGMCDLLAHRGPDDAGLFSPDDIPLTLGHRRLSIIDLSPDGHQPMRRGPLVLSYNGEVYNYLELRRELQGLGHVFHTSSDTEVLLAAFAHWGEQALQRVNGMFAILLYDEARRRLLLCRDRFGVKPLYYLDALSRGVLIAASEPKAVLYAARRLGLQVGVDRDTLACYLADGPQDDTEATFFDRCKRVLPGSLIACDLAPAAGPPSLSARAWYGLTPKTCLSPEPTQEARDERFRELLTDAVRLRLRSDVPVGTCLSGGLDSSAIVCLSALSLNVRPHAFSAVYGAGAREDESRFIDEVVAHAGVPSHRIDPQAVFSEAALLRFVALHDEPIGGTTVWAQHCVFRLARDTGMTVMLDGQGADEILTGYHGAFRPAWANLLRRHALSRLSHELRGASALHGYGPLRSLAQAAQTLVRHHVQRTAAYNRYLRGRWRGFFVGRSQAPLSPQRAFRLHVPPFPAEHPHVQAWAHKSPLHSYLYQLVVGSSLQTILRYEDRNSMAASIEARAPFLDYRLVQHCLAQPAQALLQDGYTKALLRRTLRGVLPERSACAPTRSASPPRRAAGCAAPCANPAGDPARSGPRPARLVPPRAFARRLRPLLRRRPCRPRRPAGHPDVLEGPQRRAVAAAARPHRLAEPAERRGPCQTDEYRSRIGRSGPDRAGPPGTGLLNASDPPKASPKNLIKLRSPSRTRCAKQA